MYRKRWQGWLRIGRVVVLSVVSVLFSWHIPGAQEREEAPTESEVSEKKAAIPQLETIVVTATRGETPLANVPAATGLVDKEEIQLGQETISIDESLDRIPGIFVQNSSNFAQDLRISIRGFGTRAPFGVREVKVLVDGIPETSPDGQTQLDNIDLSGAKRIEVLRGAASSLYGNASGGVIHVLTEDGPQQPFAETRLLTGSYGLWKYQAKTGGQLGKLNYFLNTSRLDFKGYRHHSRTESVTFNSKLRYDLDADSDVTLLLSLVDSPQANDPGGLTRAQVEDNPRQARDRNVDLDAGESVQQGKLGLIYRRELLPGHKAEVYTYSLFRDFANSLPILPRFGSGIVAFHRFGIGGGVKYIYETSIFGYHNRLTFGLDSQYQIDGRRRFDNESGERGLMRFHQDEEVTSVGPFVREEFSLLDNLILSGGFRYDNVHFNVDDKFLSDGDDSDSRSMEEFSPTGGIVYRPFPFLYLYGNISTAFQVPTTTELANPTEAGGFSSDLNPQTAVNYEIGARGYLWERLGYDLALFLIHIDDELIQFEGPSGRNFFRNAGESERKGIELRAGMELIAGLSWSSAYTLLDTTFRDFDTPDGSFDDNDEPGIPDHVFHTEFFYRHPSGIFGAFEVLFVDDFPVNNANTEENDAYKVLNLRLGYEGYIGSWRVAPFIGINNLTDEDYNGLVRLNALGGRYFEPAPGINVYGGLRVSYNF